MMHRRSTPSGAPPSPKTADMATVQPTFGGAQIGRFDLGIFFNIRCNGDHRRRCTDRKIGANRENGNEAASSDLVRPHEGILLDDRRQSSSPKPMISS
ncbi:hypothetical protein ACLOJK_027461 [Asimina triloba]